MVNVSTFSLKLRLFLATIFLFGILYVIIMLISSYFGFGGPLLFAVFGIIVVFIQYLIGPKMVEAMMHVHYVSEQEAPNLHAMVEDLAMKAGISKPKVGVAEISVPNAFAFGRSKGDARICVTRGILNLLDKDSLFVILSKGKSSKHFL